jgi:hypothetical protein
MQRWAVTVVACGRNAISDRTVFSDEKSATNADRIVARMQHGI